MTREATHLLSNFNLKRPSPELLALVKERLSAITTQKAIAKKLGVEHMSVNKCLNGKIRSQRILKACVEAAMISTDAQTSIVNYLNRFKTKTPQL